MAIAASYPAIKPSLSLDFANVGALDPRVTFTRSTTGTYYDGVTTAKAEENLFLYSQEMDNGWWIKTRLTVTGNTTTAPDGTSTAESTAQTAGQTSAGLVGASVTVGNLTYTQSIYAKANTKNFVVLAENLEDASVRQTWFDLSTGTIGTTNANHTAAIVSVGNGWYRCSITYTIVSAFAGSANFYHADTNGSATVTDSGGIFLWGAQLEQRSAVTAYTPTTTQPITNYIPVLQTAAAGQARFDHNPTTGEALGLLIEEQRTNLLYPSVFPTGATAIYSAINNGTATAAAIVAPDGLQTATRLTCTANSTECRWRITTPCVINTPYTSTTYVKAGSAPFVYIRHIFSTTGGITTDAVWFNLSTNAIATKGTSITTASVQPVGNGWYRLSVTSSTAGTIANNLLDVGISNADASVSCTINQTAFFWGAQLEAGAFPTSYIPTTSAQVTRNADAASMTGTNFSSWYRADAGSFVVLAAPTLAGNQVFLTASRGTVTTDNLQLYAPPNNLSIRFYVVTNSVLQADAVLGSYSGQNILAAASYANNDIAGSLNGGAVGADPSVILPAGVDSLYIGRTMISSSYYNGRIRKIAYYPQRLTNANLQALTA